MINKTLNNNIGTVNKNKKKVAIYTSSYRKSKDKECYSNEEQEMLLSEYCINNNLDVYKCYSDNSTGITTINDKPALEELLNDSEEKKFDMIIAFKIKCLGRKIENALETISIFDKNNITFKSHSEQFGTDTPVGKMQFQMMRMIVDFQKKFDN